MNLQNLVIGGLVVVALFVSVLAMNYPKAQQIVDSTKVDVSAIANAVLAEVQKNMPLGAVSGPDRSFPVESRNGIQQSFVRRTFATATNTPCAILSPGATSTLVTADAKVTTASSTAVVFRWARHTTAFATSTASIQTTSLGSGALGSFSVTATTSVADGNTVFPPSTWLVLGLEGTAHSDTTKLNGICQATFEII